MDQLSIAGTTPRRRRGVARTMLDRQLSAWKRTGTLAGDEHAATRTALRDAAEALDAARDALRAAQHHGTGSAAAADDVSRCANRHGECARRLLDMLAACAPDGRQADGFDAFLATLSGPQVRD